MPALEPHHRLETLLGRPGATVRATLDHSQCAELVALVRAASPGGQLRQETWERTAGVTLSLGYDFSVVLGLDFPSGEPFGPDGGWVRCQTATGVSHWRLTQREANRIWLLLTAHERSARPFDTAATAY